MDDAQTVAALAALAHDTRLKAFRLIALSGRDGVAAGEVSAALGVIKNTMSSHLAILERAGLISGERHGRSMRYRRDPTCAAGLRARVTLMLDD